MARESFRTEDNLGKRNENKNFISIFLGGKFDLATELINKVDAALEDRIRCYTMYEQYIDHRSANRYHLFGHFIAIHMVLLPAHAVVPYTDMVRSMPGVGIIYSILVAVLGITISWVSYRRISGIFIRIDAAYQLIHQIEQELPYRFFTVLGERMGDTRCAPAKASKWYHLSLRRMELVFHWIVGGIYVSLPFIHYNMEQLVDLVQPK